MAALGPDAEIPILLPAVVTGERRVDPVGNPLPKAFFARPAEQVHLVLISGLLVQHQAGGELLRVAIVEMESYSQDEHAWWAMAFTTA